MGPTSIPDEQRVLSGVMVVQESREARGVSRVARAFVACVGLWLMFDVWCWRVRDVVRKALLSFFALCVGV